MNQSVVAGSATWPVGCEETVLRRKTKAAALGSGMRPVGYNVLGAVRDAQQRWTVL